MHCLTMFGPDFDKAVSDSFNLKVVKAQRAYLKQALMRD